MVTVFGFSRGRSAPPRIDPGLFARARVDLGVVYCICLQPLQCRVGPPRLCTVLFPLPLGSCVFLSLSDGLGDGNFGCASVGVCFL